MKLQHIYLIAAAIFLLLPVNLKAENHTKKIIVGYFDKNPVIFKTENGEADGLAKDILTDVAHANNWHLKYVHGSFPEIIRMLYEKKIDIMVPLVYSNQRAKHFDYTYNSILQTWGALFTNRESGINTILDVNGKKIAYLEETIFYEEFKKLLDSFQINCMFIKIDSYDRMFEGIVNNIYDGGIGDRLNIVGKPKHIVNQLDYSIVFHPVELFFAGYDREILVAIDEYLKHGKNNPTSNYSLHVQKWLSGVPPEKMVVPIILETCLVIAVLAFLFYFIFRLPLVRKLFGLSEIVESYAARNVLFFSVTMLAVAWTIDSLIEFFWFNSPNYSFLHFFYASGDTNELLDRLIYIIAILFGGVVVSRVIEKLSEEQNNTRKLAEYLRVTLDSIGDAVITTDLDGKIVNMNPVAEKLTEYKTDIARNKPLPEVFNIINGETREKVENPAEEVLKYGNKVGLANHTILISKSGKEYQIADSAAPIKKPNGEIIGVVLVFRDITEEYKLQKQLQHSQKMDAIGQLAGGIAHDFNNIIGGIIGAAEVLQYQLKSDENSKKYVSMIMNSAERAAELASKLLAFSRRQKAGSTPVDIHHVIKEVVDILKTTIDKRIEIIIDLHAESAWVIGDPSQLQNVFLNLGINSSHALPDGGTIHIRTRNISLSQTYCNTSSFDIKAGSYIEIEVEDNGTGIAKEHLPHIFEPFFTTKEQGKGTGLGLSAVYGTVQQHKGAINVYSEVGKGTCFHIYFPVTEDHPSTPVIVEKPVLGEGTILLVDDEVVIRTTGKALLKEYGYTVYLAENGENALEIFKSKKDEIDLVILDMIMPKMNGRQCFYQLKKIKPDIKIIITSGFTKSGDLADLEKNGLFGFIRKPFRGAELSKIVNEAIKRK